LEVSSGSAVETFSESPFHPRSFVLRLGPVREIVETNSRFVSIVGLVLSDLLHGLLELLKSELELGLGSVRFSELGDVSHVGHFFFGDLLGHKSRNEAEGGKGNNTSLHL
jgi:hypothetical protein